MVLADGGLAFVRAARPGDEAELAALHARLSRDSNYLRYFTVRRRLPEQELMRAASVDGVLRMAFVAYVQGRLAAWAGYVGDGGESAEVAFQVEDEQQGRGLGTLLLELLAAHAHEAGLHRFTAAVLPQNRRMLQVFRDAGFPVHTHYEGGVLDVVLDIDPSRHARAALDQRHAQALARARERIAGARRDT